MSGLAWTVNLLFVFPTVVGMTDTHCCAQLLVEMGSCELFFDLDHLKVLSF
jgi:hypothetical protein